MTTLTELQELLHEKFDIEVTAIPPHASMQDGGMDSLAIAEFMFAVEDHFHITLPDDDPNINTLEQLAELVDRTVQAKAAVTQSTPARVESPATEAE